MSDNIEQRAERLSLWYIFPPFLALLFDLPLIMGLPPFGSNDSINVQTFYIYLATLPFYLGVACLPGYIYAWSGHHSGKKIKGLKKFWITLSILLGLVSSLAGGIIHIITMFPIPFAFWSAFMAAKLLWRFITT